MAKIEIPVFKGQRNNASPLVIKDENSPDMSNVRIDNPIGSLDNSVGFEKQHSVGFGNSIVAIHQLKKHGYVNVNETLFTLSNVSIWTGWPIFWTSFSSLTGYASLNISDFDVDQTTGDIYIAHNTGSDLTILKTDINGGTVEEIATGVASFNFGGFCRSHTRDSFFVIYNTSFGVMYEYDSDWNLVNTLNGTSARRLDISTPIRQFGDNIYVKVRNAVASTFITRIDISSTPAFAGINYYADSTAPSDWTVQGSFLYHTTSSGGVTYIVKCNLSTGGFVSRLYYSNPYRVLASGGTGGLVFKDNQFYISYVPATYKVTRANLTESTSTTDYGSQGIGSI